MLDGLMGGLSPEVNRGSYRHRIGHGPLDEVHSMTLKPVGRRGPSSPAYDEYEDLLNTIEQENSTMGVSTKAANGGGGINSQRRESHQIEPSSALTNLKAPFTLQTMARQKGVEEPEIDFQLEKEMIGLDVTTTNMEKKQSEMLKGHSALNKANLNESSDFDLDNY